MAHDNYPRGAGMGYTSNRRRPAEVDFRWIAQNGTRAQRRAILRDIKAAKRAGHPDADKALADFLACSVRGGYGEKA